MPPYCSPSASISTAARSRPLSCRLPVGAGRPASVDVAAARSRWASAAFLSGVGGMATDQAAYGSFIHWRMMETASLRFSSGEFADLLHQLSVDLALNLGDVDLPRGLAGFDRLGDCERIDQLAGRRCGNGLGFRRQHPPHQRPYHHQQNHQAEQAHHHISMARMMSSLVNCRAASQAPGSVIWRRWRLGEAQVDHLDLVAALLIEADRRAHQGGNLVDFVFGAGLIDDVALVVLAIDAVDQNRDRDAIDAAALDHFGLGDLGYLVIDDLFRLSVLVARWARFGSRARWTLGAAAGYLVADGHLIVAALGGGRFFARLAGTNRPALGIEFVGCFGNAVEIEVGADLDAGPPGADHGGNDRLDLLAQPFLERRAALVDGHFAEFVVAGAVGKEPAGLVDDRDALWLEPLTAEATRWRIARTCCGSRAPCTLSTMEADGSTLSRENSGRSGSTRCTRAAAIRSRPRMVRASSPSSARKLLIFWIKLVVPRASDLSNIS